MRQGGTPLELQPGDTALLYSLEQLRLPNNVLGFTVARGLLFVEALTPENTYVDPGFNGNLYTTVTNLSGRVVSIEYGSSIARLFFYELTQAVGQPYRTGPAMGVEQHLTNRPAIDSLQPVAKQSDLVLRQIVERTERSGPELSELIQRQSQRMFALLVAVIVWPAILVMVNGNQSIQVFLGGGAMANAIGTLIAAPIIWFSSKAWRKFGGS